jgi:hypothetical protein
MSGFIVNRPLQPGDVLQTREQAVQQAPDTQGAGYGELVERLGYIAAILLANKNKFAVPDHINQKAETVRKAATAIQTLTAENERKQARILELNMLAFKWMDAHDKLKAGEPYDWPCTTDMPDALARIAELEAEVAAAREALEPFAKAAMGVETFDPDYPMDGAALRASFDWYDKAQGGPLKRHSVRRSDLARARAFLARNTDGGGK